jgi:hypothetical protein
LRRAGFENITIEPGVVGRSSWKLKEVPIYRRWLAKLHGELQRTFPRTFGPYEIVARKPGVWQESEEPHDWRDLLREPGGGSQLQLDPSTGRWRSHAGGYGYPDLSGIPVIIPDSHV